LAKNNRGEIRKIKTKFFIGVKSEALKLIKGKFIAKISSE